MPPYSALFSMQLSAEEKARVAREVEEAALPFFPHDRMSFPAQVIIVTGKKPS